VSAASFEKSVDLNETEGWSLIFVARDGKCIGWIGLQDQTRKEAREALAELKEAGVRRIAMVSGDRQPVATRVAAEIGCEEAKGDCLPQNKVEFVRAVKAKGYSVAVIGDGVNDAPALAAGDIGIAMGAAGSEVAIHSATIALMNNDLRRLPFLVKLSQSTRTVINQNFPVRRAVHHRRFERSGVWLVEPDHRGDPAQRGFAHRDFQQRPPRAQR
jgi:Cd2+/Zn2+-exporting ATPase